VSTRQVLKGKGSIGGSSVGWKAFPFVANDTLARMGQYKSRPQRSLADAWRDDWVKAIVLPGRLVDDDITTAVSLAQPWTELRKTYVQNS